ncbi:MAG: diguanylate cyclase [Maritimibacter sp.]|nr:diguanylate cyclase [Maritimibacter sp.]
MAGRILIADTTAAGRTVLKTKLAAARYEILQADSGEDLFARVVRDRPDMVILGNQQPGAAGDGSSGTDARSICRRLKAHPGTHNIPVIVIDADPSRSARLDALAAGADDYLAKPYDEVTLLALVRHLLRAHVTHEELSRRLGAAEDLGLSDRTHGRPRRPRIALIGPDPQTGLAWRAGLVHRLQGQVLVIDRNGALDRWAPGDAPDAFIIGANLSHPRDGLMLLSELRSRPATRNAVIIVQETEDDPALVPSALDIGADAVTEGAFDAEETAYRLDRLLARKFEVDALRDRVDAGLNLAVLDPLTGLYNRRYAETYMRRVIAQAHEVGQPFALMLLDLDRFKSVNDTYGHNVGDEVLIETARRLQANVREVDLLVRHGGEEFLIAMPATDFDAASRAAERLRQVIGDTPVRTSTRGTDVPITVSIGVTVCTGAPDGTHTLPGLIAAADRALYMSKNDGRNLVSFADIAAA